jgi:CubicO group peptidase (beta-lactamase class C family)
MRLLSRLSLAISLACGASAAHAGSDNAAAIDALVPKWMEAAKIHGVAVAHIRDGRVDFLKTYGESAPGVPMTPDSTFNVASLTKPVFAELVLSLVAEGKLGLDTPLADYWTDPDLAGDARQRALTARLTLSHQSGFPNWRKGKLQFLFAPGEGQEYSGEGYEFTRHAVEKLTGQQLAALMQEHVLAPAGMTQSHFGWDASLAGKEMQGFDEAGAPLPPPDWKDMEPNAAANLLTTIGDYARFTQWTLGGAGLPRALQVQMATPQSHLPNPSEYFGLGWTLLQVGSETVLSKDGREGGVRTQAFVLPKSKEALVILTNSNNGELLWHPLVEAGLAKGNALNERIGRDTWHYLLQVPKEQTQAMIMGISRSPAFMSKLLYAVDATLVRESGIDKSERERAHRAVDPFVQGMVEGRVKRETAQALFAQLLHDEQGTPVLWRNFDAHQEAAWRRALEAAVTATAKE